MVALWIGFPPRFNVCVLSRPVGLAPGRVPFRCAVLTSAAKGARTTTTNFVERATPSALRTSFLEFHLVHGYTTSHGVVYEEIDMKELVVGVFAVKQLEEQRWQITNSLTAFVHVTYGIEAEVVAQLQVQSKAWQAKLAPVQKAKQKGSAWRQKNTVEIAEVRQDKEKTG